MSRTEYAAVLDNGAGPQNGYSQQQTPASQVSQRRLQHALAELGPGRPLPPPTMPRRAQQSQPAFGIPDTTSDAPPRVPTVLHPAWSAEDVMHNFEAEDGPPPMLIERARTAQLSGVPVERSGAPPSYWPGLIIGFSLSLMIGAALYFALTTA